MVLVGVRSREGPKPTSEFVLCVPNLDGDAKRIHGGLSWFGRKKALHPAEGEKYCISLHLSDCVGVTSCERGSRSQVSERERLQRRLLEMLIFYGGVMTCFALSVPLS
jgi:hypothetical protein